MESPFEMTPAAATTPRIWSSNDEILNTWTEYLNSNNFSKNVIEHYPVTARVFANAWPVLITQLKQRDIANFIDALSKKCKYLRRGTSPTCNLKRDISTCPVLHFKAECDGYKPLLPSGVLSHLTVINSIYSWLVRAEHMTYNPAAAVQADYLERHKSFFEERQRNPNRRKLRDDEVRTLVEKTPPHISIVVALQAKGFLRIHEAIKLSVEPRFFSLEQGWIDIPRDDEYGNKRLGVNHRVLIDAELHLLLDRYLRWRNRKIKRDATGNPKTTKLCLNSFGMPWSRNGFAGNFKQQLHNHARRLGIMTGNERESVERVNTHAFRAWACSWAAAQGAEPGQLRVLRGDRLPGTLDTYDHQLLRLPELYRRFGPVLGLGGQ